LGSPSESGSFIQTVHARSAAAREQRPDTCVHSGAIIIFVAAGDRGEATSLEARSEERRRRLVGHRASSHADAEAWDLDFWQSRTPEERLSALVAIRRDVELVETARRTAARAEEP
jgi:hypothetical protein